MDEKQVLENMSQGDKFRAFRNFMSNTLGISKEDIRDWAREMVKEIVEGWFNRESTKNWLNAYFDTLVTRWLDKRFPPYDRRRIMNDALLEVLAREMTKSVKFNIELLEPKEKAE